MTLDRVASRASFALALAEEAALGKKTLLLAPLGAGKTHTLLAVKESLSDHSVPFAFLDLFTAGSTPEQLLAILARSVLTFFNDDAREIQALVAEGTVDRHQSSSALLRLLDLLTTRTPATPFVWLIDEITEIRSLAYFPGLAHLEIPFAQALLAARGAVLTSSYLGLAGDLFPDLPRVTLPALTSDDLTGVPSLRSDSSAVSSAIEITRGAAGALLPLVADMRDTRDLERSLIRLLHPGGAIELTCRRQYEVLLLRSRGYAVAKRAAEAVAASRDRRLTDLFPAIGRTAGASRQYLRWLVEVGLLTQVRKRYDFADPMVGLWASLYLGRGDHPTDLEIGEAVGRRLAQSPRASNEPVEAQTRTADAPRKRADRFEEID